MICSIIPNCLAKITALLFTIGITYFLNSPSLITFKYQFSPLISGSRSSAWIEHWNFDKSKLNQNGEPSIQHDLQRSKSGVAGSNPVGSVNAGVK